MSPRDGDPREHRKREQTEVSDARSGAAHLRIRLGVSIGKDHPGQDPDEPDPERELSAVIDRCEPEQRYEQHQVLDRIRMNAKAAFEIRIADGCGRIDLVLAAQIADAAAEDKGDQEREQRVDCREVIRIGHLFPPDCANPWTLTSFAPWVLLVLMLESPSLKNGG